jgi:hypothetical protein
MPDRSASSPAEGKVKLPSSPEPEAIRPAPLQQLSLAIRGPNEEGVRVIIRNGAAPVRAEVSERERSSVEIIVRTSNRVLDSRLREQSPELLAGIAARGLDAELLPAGQRGNGIAYEAPAERLDASVEQYLSGPAGGSQKSAASVEGSDVLEELSNSRHPMTNPPETSYLRNGVERHSAAREAMAGDQRRRQPGRSPDRLRSRRSRQAGYGGFAIDSGMEVLQP